MTCFRTLVSGRENVVFPSRTQSFSLKEVLGEGFERLRSSRRFASPIEATGDRSGRRPPLPGKSPRSAAWPPRGYTPLPVRSRLAHQKGRDSLQIPLYGSIVKIISCWERDMNRRSLRSLPRRDTCGFPPSGRPTASLVSLPSQSGDLLWGKLAVSPRPLSWVQIPLYDSIVKVIVVLGEGFEPSRLAAIGPQPIVSASFTIPA